MTGRRLRDYEKRINIYPRAAHGDGGSPRQGEKPMVCQKCIGKFVRLARTYRPFVDIDARKRLQVGRVEGPTRARRLRAVQRNLISRECVAGDGQAQYDLTEGSG